MSEPASSGFVPGRGSGRLLSPKTLLRLGNSFVPGKSDRASSNILESWDSPLLPFLIAHAPGHRPLRTYRCRPSPDQPAVTLGPVRVPFEGISSPHSACLSPCKVSLKQPEFSHCLDPGCAQVHTARTLGPEAWRSHKPRPASYEPLIFWEKRRHSLQRF